MSFSHAEKTILLSALRFPSIAKSAYDTLEHKLCVLGNGYDWDADGRLVERVPEHEIVDDLSDDVNEWNVEIFNPDAGGESFADRMERLYKSKHGDDNSDGLNSLVSEVRSREDFSKYQSQMIYDMILKNPKEFLNEKRNIDETTRMITSYYYANPIPNVKDIPENIEHSWSETVFNFFRIWREAQTKLSNGGMKHYNVSEEFLDSLSDRRKIIDEKMAMVMDVYKMGCDG